MAVAAQMSDPLAPEPSALAGIYLDNASTTLVKPQAVWQAMQGYMEHVAASPGRAGHGLARQADDRVTKVRAVVAKLLGIRHASDVAFTANSTHALNIVLKGLLRPGDHVVTTTIEHNSVLRPLERMRADGLIELDIVDVDPINGFQVDDFRKSINAHTRLLAVNHASNVTGLLCPVAELTQLARDRGALVLLDASQSVGVVPINVEQLGVDFLAFTGHKSLRGPSGTGGLYVRDAETLTPLYEGGTGTSSQSLRHPKGMPHKLEAGTLNFLGIVGLGAAVEQLVARDLNEFWHEQVLLADRCRELLEEINGVHVYYASPSVDRVPVLSFILDRLYAGEVSALLDTHYQIMTRAGLHCAPLVHKTLGTAPHGTVRISLGSNTTEGEIEATTEAVAMIARTYGS